jgi:hypothetical protein
MEVIVEFIVGLILIVSFLAPFVAGLNTDTMPSWFSDLLPVAIGIGGLLIIVAFFRQLMKGGTKMLK